MLRLKGKKKINEKNLKGKTIFGTKSFEENIINPAN